MMPLVERKTCSALTVVKKGLRASIFYASLIAASNAILAPTAYSQANFSEAHSDGAAICGQNTNVSDAQESFANLWVVAGGVADTVCSQYQPQSDKKRASPKSADFNRDVFYGDKLEFALDAGWLPANIPFPFDFIEGAPYDLYPLRYTLVPVFASLRWHFTQIGGPWVLRGNWDTTFTLSATAIPKGPETHYFSYNMGVRRNFIPRNWKVTPYADVRCGVGIINAKGPLGVYYAQGQNLTFDLNMGAGARYNFNPRYAISAGLNWMHISNANLSAPAYSNYGINVYGPMFGVDVQLRRHPRRTE